MLSKLQKEKADRQKRKAELQSELAKIEELDRVQAARERKEKGERCQDNIDFLLLLVPDHDRTSCSDASACNVGDCRRCSLLDCRDSGHWTDDMEISHVEVMWGREAL
jgi:hypothetical protein